MYHAGHHVQPSGQAAGAPLVPLNNRDARRPRTHHQWPGPGHHWTVSAPGLHLQDICKALIRWVPAHCWYLSTTVMPDSRAFITSGQDQDQEISIQLHR